MVASSVRVDATLHPLFDEVWERIRQATPLRSQADLAAALEIKSPSISGAKLRGAFPLDWAFRIALLHGLSLDYLLRGQLPAFDPSRTKLVEATCESPCDEPLSRVVVTAQLSPCDVEMVYVPLVEARLSAGTGSFETSGEEEKRYGFRRDFLSRKGQPSQMVLMRVDGNSMEPEIHHGDVVLIDQSQIQPRAGAMFAVGVEDLVYIKLVDSLPGKIILKSYNEAYEPLEIDARGDLADGIRIVGKAVWLGRELR